MNLEEKIVALEEGLELTKDKSFKRAGSLEGRIVVLEEELEIKKVEHNNLESRVAACQEAFELKTQPKAKK